MTPHQLPQRDDTNIRIAAYESLLDLFTLISIVLILAAVIYAARSAAGSQNVASVVAEVMGGGSGAPPALPRNAALIIIHRTNSKDKLTVDDLITGIPAHFDVTRENITNTLSGFSPLFTRVKTIDLVLYDEKELADRIIFVDTQFWLSSHGYNNFRLRFTGTSP